MTFERSTRLAHTYLVGLTCIDKIAKSMNLLNWLARPADGRRVKEEFHCADNTRSFHQKEHHKKHQERNHKVFVSKNFLSVVLFKFYKD